VERLVTRAPPELVGAGRNSEATMTYSLERARGLGRAGERTGERASGPRGVWFRPNHYGFDPGGLTSGPRGILDFLDFV
jgi:hypothetical protein